VPEARPWPSKVELLDMMKSFVEDGVIAFAFVGRSDGENHMAVPLDLLSGEVWFKAQMLAITLREGALGPFKPTWIAVGSDSYMQVFTETTTRPPRLARGSLQERFESQDPTVSEAVAVSFMAADGTTWFVSVPYRRVTNALTGSDTLVYAADVLDGDHYDGATTDGMIFEAMRQAFI
jgi:hypothetical protein